MAAAYDYLFVAFDRPAARGAPERGASVAAAVQGGGELVGQFTPQLGWAANEAALLLRAQPEAIEATGKAADEVLKPARANHRRLLATARPSDDAARPQAGGV